MGVTDTGYFSRPARRGTGLASGSEELGRCAINDTEEYRMLVEQVMTRSQ